MAPAKIAAAVKADASYVRNWRRKEFPGRMGDDLRDRIIRYLEQIEAAPGTSAGAHDYRAMARALQEIREVADAALRRLETIAGDRGSPREGSKPAADVVAASQPSDRHHRAKPRAI